MVNDARVQLELEDQDQVDVMLEQTGGDCS
jgi:hypothetical protein